MKLQAKKEVRALLADAQRGKLETPAWKNHVRQEAFVVMPFAETVFQICSFAGEGSSIRCLPLAPKSPCRYQSFEAKANQRLNSAREDFLGQTCKFPIVDVCSGVPEAYRAYRAMLRTSYGFARQLVGCSDAHK